VIAYICDGKVEECMDSNFCYFKTGGPKDCCMRTCDEKHARYGKCEGDPEWFPERFMECGIVNDEKRYIEKERW
jgi:hypothetical protein